jgi:proteasome accessory factor A
LLDALESYPMSLADRLDWVAKRSLLDTYMAEEGVGWDDDVLHSLDLEYHNVNPETGLYYGLEQDGLMRRIVSDDDVRKAVTEPPRDTRALGRSMMIRALQSSRSAQYAIDWDAVYLDRSRYVELRNPFETYTREAKALAAELAAE